MRFFVFCCLSVLVLNSCRHLRYNFPNVTDYQIFPTREINASNQPFSVPKNLYGQLPDEFLWTVSNKDGKTYSYSDPNEFLKVQGTQSLLICRNDTLIFEKYYNNTFPNQVYTIFSVTKSFTSILTSIAIEEGYIKSVNQPVSDFIPEFKTGWKAEMTISHLLNMTSGLAEADYKDLIRLLFFYYGKDHDKQLKKLKMRFHPGQHFQYSSMTTELLGLCLERATGKKFDAYLKEKIWNPLGMEYRALISTDERGNAKTFGGLSVTPIDLMKLGLLLLHNGQWQGKQLIPVSWIEEVRCRDRHEGRSLSYSHSFWLDTYPMENVYDKNDFFAGGYGGQIVYVNPENQTVIIRTGTRETDVHWGRSLSKLSHFSFLDKPIPEDDRHWKEIIGSYKNQFGKEIVLFLENGKMYFKNKGENAGYELLATSNEILEDKERHRKFLVEYRHRKVKGIIIDDGNSSYYFSKNE